MFISTTGCPNLCEGDGDVIGVVTLPCEVAQVVLHGDQVVELSVRLGVHEKEEVEEDGEGQIEVEREEGELKEKLGTPVGHDEYVRSLLEKIQAKQQFLLNAIPTVPDVQSAWLLLLHCVSARANYQLRVVRPELVNSFAESHDQGLWRCLCAIVGVPAETCDGLTRATCTLPLSLGGLGLRSAARTQESAYWASWADTLSMVQARHPSVAELMVPSRRRIMVAKFASCQLGSDRVGWDRMFHLASVVRFGGWISAREQRARRS